MQNRRCCTGVYIYERDLVGVLHVKDPDAFLGKAGWEEESLKGSWRLGQVAGTCILVHWTVLVVFEMTMSAYLALGASPQTAAESLAFVLAVFGCVFLHELGHALAAKRYGIRTTDITLLPIGGVARLERLPREP